MCGADWQARSRGGPAAVLLAFTSLALAGTSVATGEGMAQLTASLSRSELTIGRALSVTGRLTSGGQPLGGVPVTLQTDVYPFRGFVPSAHAISAPDGSFAFELRPDRNVRLRVVSEGAVATSGPVLAATVDAKVASSARSLGRGRVRLSLHVRHAPAGGAQSVRVWWFLAARASRVFRLAAVSVSRERSPGITYSTVIVDPPARRFVYRVCMNPPWEQAMGAPKTHRRCPEATFVLPRHGR
jgi:hypothetical protein